MGLNRIVALSVLMTLCILSHGQVDKIELISCSGDTLIFDQPKLLDTLNFSTFHGNVKLVVLSEELDVYYIEERKGIKCEGFFQSDRFRLDTLTLIDPDDLTVVGKKLFKVWLPSRYGIWIEYQGSTIYRKMIIWGNRQW